MHTYFGTILDDTLKLSLHYLSKRRRSCFATVVLGIHMSKQLFLHFYDKDEKSSEWIMDDGSRKRKVQAKILDTIIIPCLIMASLQVRIW